MSNTITIDGTTYSAAALRARFAALEAEHAGAVGRLQRRIDELERDAQALETERLHALFCGLLTSVGMALAAAETLRGPDMPMDSDGERMGRVLAHLQAARQRYGSPAGQAAFERLLASLNALSVAAVASQVLDWGETVAEHYSEWVATATEGRHGCKE